MVIAYIKGKRTLIEERDLTRIMTSKVLHRKNGPAIIKQTGYKSWWINGCLHREKRPAVIRPNGYKAWWVEGKLHRLNGPAIIWPDGRQEYWLNGRVYSKLDYKGICKWF